MSDNISKTPSDRRQERNKALVSRAVGGNRRTQASRFVSASREEWAQVLATADRYY